MSQSPKQWNSEQVSQFILKELNLQEYYKIFKQHEITGQIFLNLTSDDLKDMGVLKVIFI